MATKEVKKSVKKTATSVKKPVEKKVAKTAVKPAVSEVKAAEVHGLSASVVGVDGKSKGHMTLPKELFEAKINKQLMAQAVRVFLANQRAGSASTKTRGEVEGSTRKIYRQKGTGRARHGSIRAGIFVHGGIIFGPRPHDFRMDFPEGMRRAALASALTSQYKAGNVIVVDGLQDVSKKTKEMHTVLKAVGVSGSVLLVVPAGSTMVVRAARNIEGVTIVAAHSVNTYETLMHKKVVIMKDAIKPMSEVFGAK